MMRKPAIPCITAFLLFGLPWYYSCGSHQPVLCEIITLPYYPSASATCYYNGHYYIMGDDAPSLLITDSLFRVTGSIRLTDYPGKRIPKNAKPDTEAITLVQDNPTPLLLITGSGADSRTRNSCWLVNPRTRETRKQGLDTFYRRLKNHGLQELNIEGLCSLPGITVLANRGNKSWPLNHLVVTDKKFWENQADAPISLIRLGATGSGEIFRGVSGLDYSMKSGKLLLTVSTEETPNNMDDGAIGKSYLWIIDNFPSKKKWAAVNPDCIIDLAAADPRFIGQKIESVTITRETRHYLHLVLAADNDDGASTLFRIIVEKE